MPTPEMHPVKSSLIEAVGYDIDAGELYVRFPGNPPRLYAYVGVTPEQYEALRTAESVGKHFNANIRGRNDYRRIEEEPIEGERATG